MGYSDEGGYYNAPPEPPFNDRGADPLSEDPRFDEDIEDALDEIDEKDGGELWKQ